MWRWHYFDKWPLCLWQWTTCPDQPVQSWSCPRLQTDWSSTVQPGNHHPHKRGRTIPSRSFCWFRWWCWRPYGRVLSGDRLLLSQAPVGGHRTWRRPRPSGTPRRWLVEAGYAALQAYLSGKKMDVCGVQNQCNYFISKVQHLELQYAEVIKLGKLVKLF